MLNAIKFTKASGAGNDFIIIDNRELLLPDDVASLSRSLCSRHFGIGADGILLLENSPGADFSMRYFNADGSYGGMCGNGGRCIARYAFLRGIAGKQMAFEALDFRYTADVVGEQVRLTMKDPGKITPLTLEVAGNSHEGFSIDTGSPHYVEFVPSIEQIDVKYIGRELRQHACFQPEGTNVDFFQIESENAIRIRTYERGVEAETLACGTGSVAAAIVAHSKYGMALPVIVYVRSGETLLVHAETVDGSKIIRPVLEGSAHMLFDGIVRYDSIAKTIKTIF